MKTETHIISFDDPDHRRKLWNRLKSLRGAWKIELTPWRAKRSNLQNRFYRGVIVQAAFEAMREAGWNLEIPEQAHQALAEHFLRVDVAWDDDGNVIARRIRSTTELSTTEFKSYIEDCQRLLAEYFSIDVPDPDPNWASKDGEEDDSAPSGQTS